MDMIGEHRMPQNPDASRGGCVPNRGSDLARGRLIYATHSSPGVPGDVGIKLECVVHGYGSFEGPN